MRPMNERETAAGEALAVQVSEADTTSLQVNACRHRLALDPEWENNMSSFFDHTLLCPKPSLLAIMLPCTLPSSSLPGPISFAREL